MWHLEDDPLSQTPAAPLLLSSLKEALGLQPILFSHDNYAGLEESYHSLPVCEA